MPMSRFLFRRATCLAAVLFCLSSPSRSEELAFSGTVLGMDGKPLSGAVVSLARAGTVTTTDAAGAWSLSAASPSGLRMREPLRLNTGRLTLKEGRLSVHFGGKDLSGRGQEIRPMAAERGSASARAAVGQDTLVFSLGGKVLLLDTVSSSRTGIVRRLDSTFNPRIVYGYLYDARDGQAYRTVKIGSQVWMAQNLNFPVAGSLVYSPCGSFSVECVSDSTEMAAKYGRVYPWTVAMGLDDSCNSRSCSDLVAARRRGVCPAGWHVPDDAEWSRLTDTSVAQATSGISLRAKSGLWATGSLAGTDDVGFAIVPGGYWIPASTTYPPMPAGFSGTGSDAFFWSAGRYRCLHVAARAVERFVGNGASGMSLRCIQD